MSLTLQSLPSTIDHISISATFVRFEPEQVRCMSDDILSSLIRPVLSEAAILSDRGTRGQTSQLQGRKTREKKGDFVGEGLEGVLAHQSQVLEIATLATEGEEEGISEGVDGVQGECVQEWKRA
jgi:hypothetical protein